MSYVYFILDEKSKAAKVGKANNVEQRLSDLQTGNPNILKVIYQIECRSEEHSFFTEKKYHKQLEKLHINGEWFAYDETTFKKIFNDDIKYKPKDKRDTIKITTLFGEEDIQLFGLKNSPSCYFYPNLIAQIMNNYEESSKLKIPFRTMIYPTHGKSMLLPYSDKKDRVFISSKKHEEIMELNRFKNKKSNSLESFF
jgi:hypothetical protein